MPSVSLPPTLPPVLTPTISPQLVQQLTVLLTSAPDNLGNLTDPAVLKATLTQFLLTQPIQVTLATGDGKLTATLPALPQAETNTVVQQLQNALQTQKLLTLIVPPQPDSGLQTAILQLPLNTPQAQAVISTATPASTPLPPQLPIVQVGQTLAAVVLPPVQQQSVSVPQNIEPLPTSQTVVPEQINQQSNNAAPSQPTVVQGSTDKSVSAPTSSLAANPTPIAVIKNIPLQAAPPQTTISAPPQPSTPVSLQPSAQASSSIPQPLDVQITVRQIVPPNASAPSLTNNQILATTISTDANQPLLLKAGNALLLVRDQVSLPPDTRLVLTLELTHNETVKPATLSEKIPFPALQELVATLNAVDPAQAQQFQNTRLPQPNQALGGTLMFLLSALGQGDVQAWAGRTVKNTLEKAGKLSLLAAVSTEISASVGGAQDASASTWRSYTLPLYNEQQMQSFMLHVHERASDQNNPAFTKIRGQKNEQARFLIDIHMTRIGALQLDGYVAGKKLDMVIRSENTLPSGFPQELREAYTKTLGAIGYAGSLTLQTSREGWVYLKNRNDISEVVVT